MPTTLLLAHPAGFENSAASLLCWHPQIFADQLTLSQPGRQIMPNKLLIAPPDFKNVLRSCINKKDNIRCIKVRIC